MSHHFVSGQKVIYIPEGKVYDFGYLGQTGKAIIYEEGECNMQDSSAVDPEDLKPVKGKVKDYKQTIAKAEGVAKQLAELLKIQVGVLNDKDTYILISVESAKDLVEHLISTTPEKGIFLPK